MLTLCLSGRMGTHHQFTRRCSLSPKADRVDALRASSLVQNTTSGRSAFNITRVPTDESYAAEAVPLSTLAPSEAIAQPGESFYNPNGCN